MLLDKISEFSQLPKIICSRCWLNLDKFHQFYCMVEAAQHRLSSTLGEEQPSNASLFAAPNPIEIAASPIECGTAIVPAESIDVGLQITIGDDARSNRSNDIVAIFKRR